MEVFRRRRRPQADSFMGGLGCTSSTTGSLPYLPVEFHAPGRVCVHHVYSGLHVKLNEVAFQVPYPSLIDANQRRTVMGGDPLNQGIASSERARPGPQLRVARKPHRMPALVSERNE